MKDVGHLLLRNHAINELHAATAIYTAEPVVDDLLKKIDWPRGTRRLLDPSCGDGMFLGRALERLLVAEPNIDAAVLVQLFEGWEIHPTAAQDARSRIAMVLTLNGWPPAVAEKTACQVIKNADFLTDGPTDRRYYAVVGNPPYLRFANVPDLLRQEYLSVVPDYARADLLHPFLARCPDLLEPDGVVVLVTADRWLFNASAAKLRAAMGKHLAIHHLERLDPSTAFHRPKVRRQGSPPRIHPVAVVLGPPTSDSIMLSRAAIHPEATDGCAADGTTLTLGEVAKVRQGPWLGARGIFVVDGETARILPPEYLVPAVGPRDLIHGRLGPIRRWAVKTSAIEPPAEVMAHLDANLHRMAPRGRRNPRWLPPESWGDLPLDEPSLLIPRIAKSLRPVRLPPGVLPTNHDVSIVAGADMQLEEIEAMLTSERAQEWMRIRAPRLEGGYHSITTNLLRSLPVDN